MLPLAFTLVLLFLLAFLLWPSAERRSTRREELEWRLREANRDYTEALINYHESCLAQRDRRKAALLRPGPRSRASSLAERAWA